MKDRELR